MYRRLDSRLVPRTSSVALILTVVLALPLSLAGGAIALEPGDPAPAFSLPALDGEGDVTLADHKGKVIWLDFWASWCGPCLQSLPQLEKLRKQMPAERFQIVAVNVDQDPTKALRFLDKHPIGYPSGTDPKGKTPEQFGLKTMPTSYLIDQKGVIRTVHKGYRDGDIVRIRSEIRRLVKASP